MAISQINGSGVTHNSTKNNGGSFIKGISQNNANVTTINTANSSLNKTGVVESVNNQKALQNGVFASNDSSIIMRATQEIAGVTTNSLISPSNQIQIPKRSILTKLSIYPITEKVITNYRYSIKNTNSQDTSAIRQNKYNSYENRFDATYPRISTDNWIPLQWNNLNEYSWESFSDSINNTIKYGTFQNTVFRAHSDTPISDGTTSRSGSVLMPDGRVIYIIRNDTQFPIYDPNNDSISYASGTFLGNNKFSYGVLLNDGRVYIAPNTYTSARIYDPATNSLSIPNGFFPNGNDAGTTMLDGRVFMTPNSSGVARIYDPIKDTLSEVSGFRSSPNANVGCNLLPDGRVYIVPGNNTTDFKARIYNPKNNTISTPNGIFTSGNGVFGGGCLLPNGKLFISPENSVTARIYDPVSDTLTIPSAVFPGGNRLQDAKLMPNGKLCLLPYQPVSGVYTYDYLNDVVEFTPEPSPNYIATGGIMQGGSMLLDGRILLQPRRAVFTTIFGSDQSSFDPNIPLSPFYNKR